MRHLGPLEVVFEERGSAAQIVPEGGGAPVAKVYRQWGVLHGKAYDAEANANMFAASPEMYDELCALYRLLDRMWRESGTSEHDPIRLHLVRIRAIQRKVERPK